MHQIVLLTALTATTGLFGGGRQCRSGHCGATMTRPTYYAPASTCQTGTCGTTYYAPPVAAAQAPSYQAAPVAAAPAAPAPAPVYQAARPATYSVYSYYYPAQSSCPNGNCARR